ncbi:DUF3823 domain-containing protein [Pedobacter sandarakinus]|uniref:DUF3823 domain-containing protein n=1 Tax=Pedobacter sandarakinus TaxID=353156 RepID=UPI002247A079|nr:DUF3823 domain-containing protein [Pedobacter sandarakinus]MCX2575884.1 DUF3823 domain-containing protein [Pedobacter sandarakinus]
MKRILYSIIFLALAITGCEYDNYEPPKSQLSGRLLFEGKTFGIRQGISVLQLTQPGFETVTPINVNVKQDGTFAAMLFDGDYKLLQIAGNGPWEVTSSTIDVAVRGTTNIDVQVKPYFSLNNVSFTVENNVLKSSCVLVNNVAGRQLERISLILGKTTIVDDPTKLVPSPADPLSTKVGTGLNLTQPILLSQNLAVAPLTTLPYLYARIAVKVVGVPELLYSDVFTVKPQ